MHAYYRQMLYNQHRREERNKKLCEVCLAILCALMCMFGFTMPLWLP